MDEVDPGSARTVRIQNAFLLVGFAAVAAACADAEAPIRAWSGAVRDSAGVTVVENQGPGLWRPDERWSVTPDLRIGNDEARPETLFGNVVDVEAGQGRVFVLDAMASTVRVFSEDGATVGSIGGPGEGPGELSRFASSLMIDGDTLHVVDWGNARRTRFTTEGEFVRSEALEGPPGARSWWRMGPAGPVFRVLVRRLDADGRWGGDDALLRLGPDSAVHLLEFEYAPSDLGAPGSPVVPLIVNTPAWAIVQDGSIAWTALNSVTLRLHGPSGELRRLVRRDAWTARPPSEAEQGELLERMRERMAMLGGDPSIVDQLDVVQPDVLPVLTGVVAGPDGTVWVQRMGDAADVHPMALNTPDPPTGLGGRRWDVLDAEGRYLGTLEMPERFRLLRVKGDRIYGVQRDALDAEVLVRLMLTRG